MRTLARAIGFWTFFVVWTTALGALALLLALLTLGRKRREIATKLAPWWGGPLLAAAGITLEVRNAERLAERKPRVLLLNHASTLDLFVVCALAPPGICPMVKAELRFLPVLGQVFQVLGGQLVHRGDGPRARAAAAHLARVVQEERVTAVIAPEGTRSADGTLLPFKKGAFHVAKDAEAPLLPLVIRGAGPLMRPWDWRVSPGTIVAELMPEIPPGEPDDTCRTVEAQYRAWLAAG